MRMPRMTVRWLMVAVAVVAIATGAEVSRRRSESHARQERLARQFADEAMRPAVYAMTVKGECIPLAAPDAEIRRDEYLGIARYHAFMARKCR